LLTTGHEKNVVQRQIDTADKQIDRLVSQIYGLTEEEIGLVVAATASA
jgi:hypothetical protein